MSLEPLAYSLKDAATVSGRSIDTIKRAINTTDPNAWPPPLKAKRAGRPVKDGERTNAHILVLRTELLRWLDLFPDA